MGKAEYGSPKYIAKQMKSRGLQRLRWYCQVCEKQCRDENGFKCHTQAPSHLAKLKEKGDRKHTEEYSRQFEADFLHALRLSHGTKPVSANRVYNEYIHNKTHVHMSATKWPSLAAFLRHLAATGACIVTVASSDGPPDFIITLIDHRAAEHRAKQDHIKEQRAHASEMAAQAVLAAQLRAAEEDTAQQNTAGSLPSKPAEDALQAPMQTQSGGSQGSSNGAQWREAEQLNSANDIASQSSQAADSSDQKPAKISFSLSRKRK